MSGRYEILDILTQDADGVAFHAEDRELGKEVVLRRFFPFGAEGGGLVDEERVAYEIAVRRLMGISHPALRNVLNGGTDPNDGMPFLVTEWLGGSPLLHRLREKPLSPQSAKALIDLALETCQVLSEAFQEECIWIETATSSILLNGIDPERQVTFRISPLRWLGEDESRQGLRSLLRLAEEATGWNKRMLSDGSGDGFGGWIKALRKDPNQWSLEQARFALHHGPASLAAAPQDVVHRSGPISPAHATIPAQTTAPTLKSNKDTTWWPWIAAISLTLAASIFVFWQAFRQRDDPPPPVTGTGKPAEAAVEAPTAMSDSDRIAARAAEMAAEIERMSAAHENKNPPPVAASPEVNAHLIQVGRELRKRVGASTKLEARLVSVRASKSGKTVYLEFGTSADPDAICARYRTELKAFTEEQLRGHVGKRLRIRGKVVNDPSGRVAIDIGGKKAVEVLKG